jgi:predicted type IV restriction endonuclease
MSEDGEAVPDVSTDLLPRSFALKVSKRFITRARANLKKFERILHDARARDINESDTCVILADFLSDVLGYDKYSEVTSEFMIRSTFCDLAIKIEGKLHFLIEVKSVGTDLRENHLKQAVDYAANQGCDWVILTNGIRWQAHRVKFEKPVGHEMVFEVDLLSDTAKPVDALQCLFLISREAQSLTAIEAYHARREATSPYVIAQLVLEDSIVRYIRRRLRSQFKGLKVSEDEVSALLSAEVIKRELMEGERANTAEKLVRRLTKKAAKAKAAASDASPTHAPAGA